jgi:hypothetical protein
MTESNALTALAPRSIDEAKALSRDLSTSQLLPEALRKSPADILATVMTGHELGLAPMQAIRAINVIEGQPTLKAEAMVALVRRSPVCEWLEVRASSNESCTVETKRVGHKPVSFSFSMADAERAGLVGKKNWARFPAAMLRARAFSAACRAVYQDVILGINSAEEMLDEVRADSGPTSVASVPEAIEGSYLVREEAPPESKAKEAASNERPREEVASKPAGGMEARIAECQTAAELGALVSPIMRLSGEEKHRAMEAYNEKRKALRRVVIQDEVAQ